MSYQPDPSAIQRIVHKLGDAGWLAEGTSVLTVGDATTGTVNFSPLGLANLQKFYSLHAGLWDLDPDDFVPLWAFLMERSAMLADRLGHIDHE